MEVRTLNDKDLICAFKEGRLEAFEELLARHKTRVYNYILLMVKDRRLADDIFQETFVKVIQTLQAGRYNEEGKFLPWVMRISHNIVIDQYRRHKKMPMVRGKRNEDEDFDIFSVLRHADASPEERLIRHQTEGTIRRLIRHLPREQKEVLMMRIYGELSFNEIAEQTQVSINTALGRMRYALINLRKLVRKAGILPAE